MPESLGPFCCELVSATDVKLINSLYDQVSLWDRFGGLDGIIYFYLLHEVQAPEWVVQKEWWG